MDILQAARFFDLQDFDTYNFVGSSWVLNAFKGQLKRADQFVSIWNRPTRKRMLFTAPDQVPSASVIRCPATGEIFLVGTTQKDSHANTQYRTITGLHMSAGTAVLKRRAPVGPSNDPGWAVQSTVITTFADAELRSVDEGQNYVVTNYGHFFLFLPKDTPAQLHDTLELDGKTYYILELYVDSGFLAARGTTMPDERTDLVYKTVGAPVYSPATQTNSPAVVSYNVTAKATLLKSDQLLPNEITLETIEVLIDEAFIGVEPKKNDQIVYLGKTYTVKEVSRNAILTEWKLRATV